MGANWRVFNFPMALMKAGKQALTAESLSPPSANRRTHYLNESLVYDAPLVNNPMTGNPALDVAARTDVYAAKPILETVNSRRHRATST